MKTKIVSAFAGILLLLFSNSVRSQNQYSNPSNSSFIENKGQISDLNYTPNPAVLFLYNSPGFKIQLKKNGFSYDVYTWEKHNRSIYSNNHKSIEDSINWHFQRIDIELVNCNPNASILPKVRSSDYTNYYNIGVENKEVLYVYQYNEVYYQNIYDKIDLQFVIEDNKPKYNFILHPGAKIEDILLSFKGQDDIGLTKNKDIEIVTKQGNVIESIPFSYYAQDKKPVAIEFTKKGDGLFGFVGEFENAATMIIDPSPSRVWSTYFGSSTEDEAARVAVDKEGNPIICGYTSGLTNVASSGHQNFLAGSYDAFVAKFNDSGKRIWATYYGGNASGGIQDVGKAVAVDNDNNIYLGGTTTSTDNIGFRGFRDTLYSKNYSDAFLVKFTKNGTRIWGTYYGGSREDWGAGVCADKLGNIYLSGETRSNDNISLGGHQNAFASTSSGIGDGFLVKFDSSGNRIWATYFGGPNHESIYCVTTDTSNNVLIGGLTQSTSGLYLNGHQNYYAGTSDGIVAKFSPFGTLLWSTYYGGSAGDFVKDITTDKDNNVYIAGSTSSTTNIAYNGPDEMVAKTDAFVAVFSANGTRIMGTYRGSPSTLTNEEGTAVAVDSEGNIYLTGFGTLLNSNNMEDIFLVKYRLHKYSNRYTIDKIDYYAGTKQDYSYGLATYNNILYMTGGTYSSGMSSSSSISSIHQASFGGTMDAFLMRFDPATILISNVPAGPFCYGDTFSINYEYVGTMPLQSGNEFKVYSHDSLGNFDTKLGSAITTNTKGKILVTILDVNVKAYTLRVWASKPEIYGELSDTFSVKNRSDVSFQIDNYFSGDTAKCLKGNRFFFKVKLTDTSQVKSHIWDFGDGDSSSLWVPNKIYALADTYDIKLKTFSPSYGCSAITTKRVYVWPTPKAAFNVDKTNVCENDTINYVNNSTSSGEVLYYTWNLPTSNYVNGTNASSANVVQYYSNERLFNPILYVTNSYNCRDTAIGTRIAVSKAPSASFSINFLKPCLNGNSVALNDQTFLSTSLPKNLTYLWDFGDGTTSTDQFPTKIYNSVGTKKIWLKSTNNGTCSDSVGGSVIIRPNPIAAFTINNDTQCLNGNQFVFSNGSSLPGGGTTTNSWSVGSATSSAINPTFTLNSAGNYTARLIVRATTGCSDSIEKNILVHPSPSQVINGPITSKGKKQDVYSVMQNAGSIYQWQVSGGNIVGATTTNQVAVRWDENAGSVGQVFLIETNAAGCVGNPSIKVVNLEPSSINGIENIYNINLYPNPANNEVGINMGSYSKHYSATIFNSLGEEVFSAKEIIGNSLLPLDSFANGIYFVHIEGENFSFKQKLIIQKQ